MRLKSAQNWHETGAIVPNWRQTTPNQRGVGKIGMRLAPNWSETGAKPEPNQRQTVMIGVN